MFLVQSSYEESNLASPFTCCCQKHSLCLVVNIFHQSFNASSQLRPPHTRIPDAHKRSCLIGLTLCHCAASHTRHFCLTELPPTPPSGSAFASLLKSYPLSHRRHHRRLIDDIIGNIIISTSTTLWIAPSAKRGSFSTLPVRVLTFGSQALNTCEFTFISTCRRCRVSAFLSTSRPRPAPELSVYFS